MSRPSFSLALLTTMSLLAGCYQGSARSPSDDSGGQSSGSGAQDGSATDTGDSDSGDEPVAEVVPEPLHRLNRLEYNNTVRDLLATSLTPADNFPPDNVTLGFDNIAEGLTLTPAQMDLYATAARDLARATLETAPRYAQRTGARGHATATGQAGVAFDWGWSMSRHGEGLSLPAIELAQDELLTVSILAGGDAVGEPTPEMGLLIDNVEVGHWIVTSLPTTPIVYTVQIPLAAVLVKARNPATRFPSLQWGAGEPMACDFAAACSYTQSISWAGPQAPLAPVINPLTAFNQLFSGADEGATAEAQAIRRASLKSVLDYVLADADSLSVQLGAEDRDKLDEYFTAVRELETRLTNPAGMCESGPAPADALDYPGRVQAFNDLIALAFQCDQSQIITFMLENGLSGRSHPFIGAPGGHHGLTHGAGDNPGAQLLALETWQAEQAAALATKLKSMPDIDGSSILDNTAMLVLTDMGDGGAHDHTSLSQVLIGRCGGALHTGQALHYNAAPLGNMYVSLLRALGVDTTTFGVDGVAPLDGVNV